MITKRDALTIFLILIILVSLVYLETNREPHPCDNVYDRHARAWCLMHTKDR